MAKFFTTFESYAVESYPHNNWFDPWASTLNSEVRLNATTNEKYFYTVQASVDSGYQGSNLFSPVSDSSNTEVLIRARGAAVFHFGADPDRLDKNGNAQITGYRFTITNGPSGSETTRCQIQQDDGGVYASFIPLEGYTESYTDVPWSELYYQNIYWVRAKLYLNLDETRAYGYFKVWQDGSTEPFEWTYAGYSTKIYDGYFGAQQSDIYQVGAGTLGDAPPIAPTGEELYTGSRTLPPIDLSQHETASGSHISWTASIPENSNIVIQTSITDDNIIEPTEWLTATNGQSIPSISNGDNLIGKYLWVKQILSATGTIETVQTPVLHSMTIKVYPQLAIINAGKVKASSCQSLISLGIRNTLEYIVQVKTGTSALMEFNINILTGVITTEHSNAVVNIGVNKAPPFEMLAYAGITRTYEFSTSYSVALPRVENIPLVVNVGVSQSEYAQFISDVGLNKSPTFEITTYAGRERLQVFETDFGIELAGDLGVTRTFSTSHKLGITRVQQFSSVQKLGAQTTSPYLSLYEVGCRKSITFESSQQAGTNKEFNYSTEQKIGYRFLQEFQASIEAGIKRIQTYNSNVIVGHRQIKEFKSGQQLGLQKTFNSQTLQNIGVVSSTQYQTKIHSGIKDITNNSSIFVVGHKVTRIKPTAFEIDVEGITRTRFFNTSVEVGLPRTESFSSSQYSGISSEDELPTNIQVGVSRQSDVQSTCIVGFSTDYGFSHNTKLGLSRVVDNQSEFEIGNRIGNTLYTSQELGLSYTAPYSSLYIISHSQVILSESSQIIGIRRSEDLSTSYNSGILDISNYGSNFIIGHKSSRDYSILLEIDVEGITRTKHFSSSIKVGFSTETEISSLQQVGISHEETTPIKVEAGINNEYLYASEQIVGVQTVYIHNLNQQVGLKTQTLSSLEVNVGHGTQKVFNQTHSLGIKRVKEFEQNHKIAKTDISNYATSLVVGHKAIRAYSTRFEIDVEGITRTRFFGASAQIGIITKNSINTKQQVGTSVVTEIKTTQEVGCTNIYEHYQFNTVGISGVNLSPSIQGIGLTRAISNTNVVYIGVKSQFDGISAILVGHRVSRGYLTYIELDVEGITRTRYFSTSAKVGLSATKNILSSQYLGISTESTLPIINIVGVKREGNVSSIQQLGIRDFSVFSSTQQLGLTKDINSQASIIIGTTKYYDYETLLLVGRKVNRWYQTYFELDVEGITKTSYFGASVKVGISTDLEVSTRQSAGLAHSLELPTELSIGKTAITPYNVISKFGVIAKNNLRTLYSVGTRLYYNFASNHIIGHGVSQIGYVDYKLGLRRLDQHAISALIGYKRQSYSSIYIEIDADHNRVYYFNSTQSVGLQGAQEASGDYSLGVNRSSDEGVTISVGMRVLKSYPMSIFITIRTEYDYSLVGKTLVAILEIHHYNAKTNSGILVVSIEDENTVHKAEINTGALIADVVSGILKVVIENA